MVGPKARWTTEKQIPDASRIGLALVLHSFSDGGSEAALHGCRFAALYLSPFTPLPIRLNPCLPAIVSGTRDDGWFIRG